MFSLLQWEVSTFFFSQIFCMSYFFLLSLTPLVKEDIEIMQILEFMLSPEISFLKTL